MFVRVKEPVPYNLVLEAITRFDEFVDKAKVTKDLMLEYTETEDNRAVYFTTNSEYNATVMIRIEDGNRTRDYFIEFELDVSEKLELLAKIVKTCYDIDLRRKVRE